MDPIGIKAIASVDRRIAPVAPPSVAQTPVVQPAQTVAKPAEPARAPSGLQALSEPAAASPPIDVERVARIKQAIEDGKFPLIPSTIADRLIALRLQWNPNEPA